MTDIPHAPPYWEPNQKPQLPPRPPTRKRSAGERELLSSSTSLSIPAKKLLQGLLKEHNVNLGSHNDPPSSSDDDTKTKQVATVDMSDETILQLATAGKLNFLKSILKTMDDSEQAAVSSRAFIKACSLAVAPALTPGQMDAKEMVLAALHFLSGNEGTNIGILPLLRPVQKVADLEKRTYEKVGDWKLGNIETQVAALEDVFMSDNNDYMWLSRGRFCPCLVSGEDMLLLKGNPPAAVTGKSSKKTATVQRKKKGSTARNDMDYASMMVTSSMAGIPVASVPIMAAPAAVSTINNPSGSSMANEELHKLNTFPPPGYHG